MFLTNNLIDNMIFLDLIMMSLKRKTVRYGKIKDKIVMILFLLMSIVMKVIAKRVNILIRTKSKQLFFLSLIIVCLSLKLVIYNNCMLFIILILLNL